MGTEVLGDRPSTDVLTALRSLGQHLTDGLVLVDGMERVRWLNPAARRLLGCGLARASGMPLRDLVQPLNPDNDPEPAGALRWWLVQQPGRRPRRRILVESIPLHQGDPLLGTVHLLVRPEPGELADASRRLAPLIASLSHEIRAPLAAAVAAFDLLDEPSALQEATALAQSARRSVLWLSAVVDNLLTATSLTTGDIPLVLAPVALTPLVAETGAYLAPLLARKKQTLAIDSAREELIVCADRQRLQQVLVNLITNAIKYGPFGQPIRVGLAAEAGRVRVTVSDEGPGIALADQERVFERFYRADKDAVPGRTGVGLGLAIVRAIVERHGGTVGVHSLPGRGSVFWFTLPLHSPAPSTGL